MIDLDRDGDVWILRMDDGENRFNRRWLNAFNGALDRVEAAEAPAALVTTGVRKFYTNGMDLDWLATISAEAAGFLAEVNRLFARLLGFPVATAAAVNGHAFGAGAVLAVAHDVVVMREDRGDPRLPEADLGFPITPSMFAVIAAKLRGRTAQEASSPAAATGHPPPPRPRGSCTMWQARTRCSRGLSSWPRAWLARNAARSRSTST